MSADTPIIHHISDTARWAAVYRARETERPDAVFRDPYARRLAGERGEEIARSQPFHEENAWSWVARTYNFDDLITGQIQQGVDMVVNLAAGLDARPYRMALPSSLQWIEVDHPEILDYKEEILSNEKPNCMLEQVRLDLADVEARRVLFNSLGTKATKALIISEGLLIYLSNYEVAALAQDLARPPAFQRWALDVVSPGLLKMIQEKSSADFSTGSVPLKFAPADGPQFFSQYGWQPLEVRSTLKTAAKLKRLTLRLRFFSLFPEDPEHMGGRPWAGACLMERR
jgi:methyltransferase (TIGR00027 family)